MENAITVSFSPLWVIIFVLLGAVIVLTFMLLRLLDERKQKHEIEEKYKQLEMQVNNLELESIQYKLNPHLFKNTLNAIQSHAYQTYNALDKLANVLDYILYESDRQFVSLKEEVDFALSLIEINKLKVSPLFDLRIKQKIDDDDPMYGQKVVAPLITVNLIENAFKHADLQREDAFIAVVFELRDGQFFLTVSNKVSRKPAPRKTYSGFGQENFKKRLSILYKNNFTLDTFVEDDVYIAHLKLDLREHQAQMHTVGR